MKNLSFFSTHLEPVVQRSSAIHNMLNTKLGCCQNQLRTCKTVQAHSSVHKLYNGMSGFITKASSETADPTVQPTSSTAGQKPEPPPQQHLRPPESQSFLPKDSEPLPKPMPTKPAQATQQPQGQPLAADRPGSSKDDVQDLSSADPASVYMPQLGQDLDLNVFRSRGPPPSLRQAPMGLLL